MLEDWISSGGKKNLPVSMEATFSVVNTTIAVVKVRPEKNSDL